MDMLKTLGKDSSFTVRVLEVKNDIPVFSPPVHGAKTLMENISANTVFNIDFFHMYVLSLILHLSVIQEIDLESCA